MVYNARADIKPIGMTRFRKPHTLIPHEGAMIFDLYKNRAPDQFGSTGWNLVRTWAQGWF